MDMPDACGDLVYPDENFLSDAFEPDRGLLISLPCKDPDTGLEQALLCVII